MKNILIVYHTITGGTLQMARAAAEGAGSEAEVEVQLVHASEAGVTEVLEADGYIFATGEYLAIMAGMVKDFFERTYYQVLGKIEGRPYAILICAGSVGENAARQVARTATGWRLKPIAEPFIVCTHAQTPETVLASKTIRAEDLERCREIGATLASGMALGIY